MTFEEANRRVKEHIKEYDDIMYMDYDIEKAFDIDLFTGDRCSYCAHEEECNLNKFLKEREWEPVCRCKMWQSTFL